MAPLSSVVVAVTVLVVVFVGPEAQPARANQVNPTAAAGEVVMAAMAVAADVILATEMATTVVDADPVFVRILIVLKILIVLRILVAQEVLMSSAVLAGIPWGIDDRSEKREFRQK